MEVPFDVSHAGQLRLIKQSLCTNGSEFRWGGQYTHFIKFCQKAQWNVCGTLFLCMSPSMEFLIADVATRSLLMSFVKDNYGLGGMAREGMKSWLCAVRVDVVLRPLLLSIPCVWPALHVSKKSRPPFHYQCCTQGWATCSSTFALFILHFPNLIAMYQAGAWHKVMLLQPFPRAFCLLWTSVPLE